MKHVEILKVNPFKGSNISCPKEIIALLYSLTTHITEWKQKHKIIGSLKNFSEIELAFSALFIWYTFSIYAVRCSCKNEKTAKSQFMCMLNRSSTEKLQSYLNSSKLILCAFCFKFAPDSISQKCNTFTG